MRPAQDEPGATPASDRPVYVNVALTPPIPRKGPLTYSVPPDLAEQCRPGVRVRVPLGRGSRTGIVLGTVDQAPGMVMKPISACLAQHPFLDGPVLDLCARVARYYMASIEDVLATIVPTHVPRERRSRTVRLLHALAPEAEAALKRRSPRQWAIYEAARRHAPAPVPAASLNDARAGAGAARRLVELGLVELVDDDAPAAGEHESPIAPPPPTPAQDIAIDALTDAVRATRFQVSLLFGVTGSGKTDVYLGAAAAALAEGRSVLILTPEIGLAHEAAARARRRFGARVALLHSAMAPGERWSEWTRASRGEGMIAVGPRSAVFAPLARLGLIVVDEEHDPAYKQDEGIRYHGRDVAIMRAQRAVCPVVLASATPSIESFHHATTGRYQLLELRDRPGGRALPAVTLLDVRAEDTRGRRGLCAPSLETAIVDTAARGGQSLLFLNRRGFAHFVHCLSCGEPVTCGECSVTLTLHRERRALVCHHCGFVRPLNLACPGCGTPAVEGRAPGTEQVETLLRRRFPALRIARMDRDSTVRRGAHSRLLTTWHRGEVDVMVGTQMVTKGIDNPRVMLVGVLNADISLNQPDFRAGERTFQLVTQVAGRAGRGDAAGRVIVQTLRPDHYSLRAAMAHDYRALFAEEIASRQALGYPPFRRLINVRAEARDPTTAERVARDLAATIRGGGGAATARIDVLGPAPSPIERLRGWNRWQLLVRGTDRPAMRAAVARGLATIDAQRRATVRIVVDVDPISML